MRITLLFWPGVSMADASSKRTMDAVRAAIANRTACPMTFQRSDAFRGFELSTLKIENNVPLQKLMQAIHGAFPETPPYRGQHREVISHLTIAFADNDLELDQIVQQARAGLEAHLQMSVEAQQVIVAQENLNGIWSNSQNCGYNRPD